MKMPSTGLVKFFAGVYRVIAVIFAVFVVIGAIASCLFGAALGALIGEREASGVGLFGGVLNGLLLLFIGGFSVIAMLATAQAFQLIAYIAEAVARIAAVTVRDVSATGSMPPSPVPPAYGAPASPPPYPSSSSYASPYTSSGSTLPQLP